MTLSFIYVIIIKPWGLIDNVSPSQRCTCSANILPCKSPIICIYTRARPVDPACIFIRLSRSPIVTRFEITIYQPKVCQNMKYGIELRPKGHSRSLPHFGRSSVWVRSDNLTDDSRHSGPVPISTSFQSVDRKSVLKNNIRIHPCRPCATCTQEKVYRDASECFLFCGQSCTVLTGRRLEQSRQNDIFDMYDIILIISSRNPVFIIFYINLK